MIAAFVATAAAACSRSSSEDRWADLKVALMATDDVPVQTPRSLTVLFTGYEAVYLTPEQIGWEDPTTPVMLKFLLPAVGKQVVFVTVTADVPDAEAMADMKTTASNETTSLTIRIHRPHPDGGMPDAGGTGGAYGTGGAGGGGRGGSNAGGAGGANAGGTGGMAATGGAGGGGGSPPDAGVGDTSGVDASGGSGGSDTACDDGAVDHSMPSGLTCADYCTQLQSTCGADPTACLRECTGLHWADNMEEVRAGNRLYCRYQYAREASDPFLHDQNCAAATSSADAAPQYACGTPCEVFCDAGRINCPGQAVFGSSCAATCATFSMADLTCRIDALVNAGVDTGAAAIAGDCQRAGVTGSMCTP